MDANKINLEKARINRIKKSNMDKIYIFTKKLQKNSIKYKNKQIKDIENLKKELGSIGKDSVVHMFTNLFDSPSLIKYIDLEYGITEAYISSWAITDRGLSILNELSEKGIKCELLLDKTYSYKWVFQSGANEMLKNVNFKFTENHSKIILLKTNDLFISFIGSMNLSNNPRLENIILFEGEDIFNFYKQSLQNYTNDKQGNLFESQ